MAGLPDRTNITEWHLDDTEIAYNLEKTPTLLRSSEDKEWKLYVPKLMPLIEMGTWKETTYSLSDACFANEKSCKPTIQKTIKRRNYVMATRPYNCSFLWPAKYHGMKIEVEVLYHNRDNLRITNHIDYTRGGKRKGE